MKKNYAHVIQQVGAIADSWLPVWREYAHVPGVSVAITYKGKLSYANGFGYADLRRKEIADSKTVFRIASISKVFTAIAVMQLGEKGALKLDDPVCKFVPWFTAKTVHGNASRITIEDLLSHSAGIFRDGDTMHWGDGEFPEDLEESFTENSLRFKRGKRFKYSNYGYSVLGEVVAQASGQAYEAYIQANILKPLKMDSTFIDYVPDLAHHAVGYGRFIPGQEQEPFPQYPAHAYAAATGYSSSVEDVSRLMAALTYGATPKILSDRSKKRMVEKGWETGAPYSYGLGLDIFTVGKRKIYGHSGGYHGFSLMTLVDPKEALTVTVFTNVTNSPAQSLALGILSALYKGAELQKAGKQPNYSRYIGIYRNHWRDLLCAPLGSSLIAFSADSHTPTSGMLILEPTDKEHQFMVKADFLFTAHEEPVQFTDFKHGKAQALHTYLGVMKRI